MVGVADVYKKSGLFYLTLSCLRKVNLLHWPLCTCMDLHLLYVAKRLLCYIIDTYMQVSRYALWYVILHVIVEGKCLNGDI